MRHPTQIATTAVLLAIALASAAIGSAASLPALDANVEPVIPTVTQPAESGPVSVPTVPAPAPSARALAHDARDRLLAKLADVRTKSRAGAVLVIPSAQMKPEDTAALIEDLTIMSRIFEKKLADEHLIPTGYRYWDASRDDLFKRFFSKDSYTTRAIYVEGLGSLFLIDVDLPLSPPPQIEAAKPEDGTDQLWERTKDDIYRPVDSRRRKKEEPKEQYDAEKIDDLQRTLIKALKHAANIRGLKAEESVTIMVRGSDITVPLAKNESPLAAEYRRMTGELTAVQPTFLTIRAKKTDIDSFAKNKLDYDQLRQRIQTLAY